MGYHAGKPMESVVYCFYKITLSFLSLPAQQTIGFYQSERAYYPVSLVSYFIKAINFRFVLELRKVKETLISVCAFSFVENEGSK